jgi:lipopolysaccharide export system protein LptA
MLKSCAEGWRLLLCVAVVAATPVAVGAGSSGTTPAAAATGTRTLAPELEFGQLDYQRGKVLMREVTIRQDQMRVQADRAEATGLDFDDSNWKFSGHVMVQLPEGQLQAEQALVQFKSGRILGATVNGSPANFAQQPQKPGSGARGHATEIRYEVASGDVQLSGDAWISDENREISSQRIVYSIPQRSFRAESAGNGADRVRGTIKPTPKAAATGDGAGK